MLGGFVLMQGGMKMAPYIPLLPAPPLPGATYMAAHSSHKYYIILIVTRVPFLDCRGRGERGGERGKRGWQIGHQGGRSGG